MSLLSDAIEAYLLHQMDNQNHEVQVKRGELAQRFGCAPSQINYVLSTRFTPALGYYIESQRGGGGYIRIVRIPQDDSDAMLSRAMEHCLKPLPEAEAKSMLQNLLASGFIIAEEASIMASVLSDCQLKKYCSDADSMRSDLLIRMLAALRIQRKKEKDHGTV